MENFQDRVKAYKFEEAEGYIKVNVAGYEIIKVLHWLAEEETGILTYTFTNFLAVKHGTAFWHQASAVLLMESISGLPFGHQAGYYHLSKAISLAPADWKLKEYALNFYKEGLIDLEDAESLALDVLMSDPSNQLAAEVKNSILAC